MNYVEDIAQILFDIQLEIDLVNDRFQEPLKYNYKTPVLRLERSTDFLEDSVLIKEGNKVLGRLKVVENRGAGTFFLVIMVGRERRRTPEIEFERSNIVLEYFKMIIKEFYPLHTVAV